jgi:hypothetical protein
LTQFFSNETVFESDDLLNIIFTVMRVIMRFIIRIIFPTEAGNKAVIDPNFLKNIQGFIENNKAEAAYFSPSNGERSATFVIDMSSTDMMPVIAEPFFRMGARVEISPVMNFEDLKKGLSTVT